MSTSAYQERILGYFDILGWSDLVAESASRPELLSELESALTGHGLEIRPPDLLLQFTQFSDHVCISTLASQERALTVVQVTLGSMVQRLLKLGYLSRGALVVGPLLHRGNTILGPALAEAHEIESQVARYPRIVFSERACEVAGSVSPPLKTFLRRDVDGLSFMDMLGLVDSLAEIQEIRNSVTGRPLKRDTLAVRSQRGWFFEYLRRREDELRATACG